jgi:hypothetical protein
MISNGSRLAFKQASVFSSTDTHSSDTDPARPCDARIPARDVLSLGIAVAQNGTNEFGNCTSRDMPHPRKGVQMREPQRLKAGLHFGRLIANFIRGGPVYEKDTMCGSPVLRATG